MTEKQVADLFKNSKKPSGYAKDNIPKMSASGRRTIPDLTRSRNGKPAGILEVKDAKYVSFSRQIRAQNQIAHSQKVPHSLVVGPKTRVSKPAQNAIRATNGVIWRHDPHTNRLKAHENFSPSQRRKQGF